MRIFGRVSGPGFTETSANVALAILLFISVYQSVGFWVNGAAWLSVCFIVSGGASATVLLSKQRAPKGWPVVLRLVSVSLMWSALTLSLWVRPDTSLDWFYACLVCGYLLTDAKVAKKLNGLGLLALSVVLGANYGLGVAAVQLLPLIIVMGLANYISVQIAYLNSALDDLHMIDPLTGCANRRYLQLEMSKAAGFRQRYLVSMSAVALKVDDMPRQIETIGHEKFDALLVELTQVWKSRLRNTDTLCRYSDDMFIGLLPSTHSDNATLLAEDLVKAGEAYEYSGSEQVSVSYHVVEHDGIESWESWYKKLIRGSHDKQPG